MIGGAVIDHHDLEFGVDLFKYPGEEVLQILCFIPGTDYYGNSFAAVFPLFRFIKGQPDVYAQVIEALDQEGAKKQTQQDPFRNPKTFNHRLYFHALQK